MPRLVNVVAVVSVLGLAMAPALGQTPRTPEELAADVAAGARANRQRDLVPFPSVDAATSRDWPLHNFDLLNSRFAPLDQIDTSNVPSLAVRWLYHAAGGRATPVVAGWRDVRHHARQRRRPRRGDGARGLAQQRGQRLARRGLRRWNGVRGERRPGDGARRPHRRVRARLRRGRRVPRAHGGAADPLSGARGADRVGLPLQHGAAVPRRRARRRHGAQREPHSGRHPVRARRPHRRAAVAVRHHSAGSGGRRVGDRPAYLGRGGAPWRRRLGHAGHRRRDRNGAPDGRQPVARPGRLGAQGDQSVHERLRDAGPADRGDRVVLPADPPRSVGLRRRASSRRCSTSTSTAARCAPPPPATRTACCTS